MTSTVTIPCPDTGLTLDVDVQVCNDTQGDHAAGLVGDLTTVQPVSARVHDTDELVDLDDLSDFVNESVAALRPRDL